MARCPAIQFSLRSLFIVCGIAAIGVYSVQWYLTLAAVAHCQHEYLLAEAKYEVGMLAAPEVIADASTAWMTAEQAVPFASRARAAVSHAVRMKRLSEQVEGAYRNMMKHDECTWRRASERVSLIRKLYRQAEENVQELQEKSAGEKEDHCSM